MARPREKGPARRQAARRPGRSGLAGLSSAGHRRSAPCECEDLKSVRGERGVGDWRWDVGVQVLRPVSDMHGQVKM